MMQTRRRGIQVRLKAPFRDFTLYSNFSHSYQISPRFLLLLLSLPARSLAVRVALHYCRVFLVPLVVEGPAAVVQKSFTPSRFFFSFFFFSNKTSFSFVILLKMCPVFYLPASISSHLTLRAILELETPRIRCLIRLSTIKVSSKHVQ